MEKSNAFEKGRNDRESSIDTQTAAGVTSSLSKLELDRTKTTKLPRMMLPTSTPSSKNSAPPLQ